MEINELIKNSANEWQGTLVLQPFQIFFQLQLYVKSSDQIMMFALSNPITAFK